jgi:homogentisate 1,2-dioxygenase
VAYYRQLGAIPPKRHTQFRQPDGSLYAEELVGQEGFSSRSSLLYHRHAPTGIIAAEAVDEESQDLAVNHPLLPRHFKTHELKAGGDAVTGRRLLMGNADVRSLYVHAVETSPLYRNAIGDELVFVETGDAVLESSFGRLEVTAGDYVVIPTSVLHRWVLAQGESVRLFFIESRGHIGPPSRYLSKTGQFLENAPYCERDLKVPTELVEVDDAAHPDGVDVLIRNRNGMTRHTFAHHPFDVVGWDGCAYPYALSIFDFEPIVGRIHQPPPVHQTFEGPNIVICSFVPRYFDWHPDSIPAPYNHANVDSDEVLFYWDGDFMSRKGSGIEAGSISLHPAGFVHGPQPGSVEASLGKQSTKEYAVMLDTFAPLDLGPAAFDVEDQNYPWSWTPKA